MASTTPTGCPGLGAFLAGGVEGSLGRVEVVAYRVERGLGMLGSSLRFCECFLGRGQPTARAGKLAHRLTASPAFMAHGAILASDSNAAKVAS